MHNKQPLAQIVYNHLYPHPRPNDPTSFSAHLTRNLVPEVRVETATFYGALDCVEARYPGLDYSYSPHRMRLGRFQWHRRLFRAFDELRLTEAEIASLCRWEGTRWARERYERDEGITVRDTTGEDIPDLMDSRVRLQPRDDLAVEFEVEEIIEEDEEVEDDDGNMEQSGDESDEEVESVGLELNQRLLAAAAARERGTGAVMDEAWEQWLKDAAEQGILTDVTSALRAGLPFPPIPTNNTTSTTAAANVLDASAASGPPTGTAM
ncbi:MAG: hypothetical protein M1827_001283 [Pycnora praestabilis]|nr:MAG: hypothetical protein M1827_001283 [Pycnora praestabilis]